MANACNRCGTNFVTQDADICLKCRSDLLLPQCDYFYYKGEDEGYVIDVPWCGKYDKRALGKYLKCRGCRENNK